MLDNIFQHPNVGPFIGRRLIQHLTTSHPSPAYISRVAGVFADNGRGVSGDLRAVVRAILLDPETRGDTPSSAQFGKLREPVLHVTGVMCALGARSDGVDLIALSSGMAPDLRPPGTTRPHAARRRGHAVVLAAWEPLGPGAALTASVCGRLRASRIAARRLLESSSCTRPLRHRLNQDCCRG